MPLILGAALITSTYLLPPPPYIQEAAAASSLGIGSEFYTSISLPKAPEGLISDVALETHIASTSLYNLVKSESNLDPNAVGDHGCSLGLTQQNTCTTKVTKEEALDPLTALRIAAADIKNGTDSRYTVCNCYSWIRTKFPKGLVPSMNKITPNTPLKVGAVAIFYYGKVEHLAYVTSVNSEGFEVSEANYIHCKIGDRFIKNGDIRLVGFWTP